MTTELARLLGMAAVAGLALEAAGLLAHARDMKARGDEGAASHYEQTTRYGYPYLARNGLLAMSLTLAAALAMGAGAAMFVPAAPWPPSRAAHTRPRPVLRAGDPDHHAGSLLLAQQGFRRTRTGSGAGGHAATRRRAGYTLKHPH